MRTPEKQGPTEEASQHLRRVKNKALEKFSLNESQRIIHSSSHHMCRTNTFINGTLCRSGNPVTENATFNIDATEDMAMSRPRRRVRPNPDELVIPAGRQDSSSGRAPSHTVHVASVGFFDLSYTLSRKEKAKQERQKKRVRGSFINSRVHLDASISHRTDTLDSLAWSQELSTNN